MALMRVRYKGLSDWREMSVKALASVGIGVSGDLLWDASNRKTLYIKDPSEEMLAIFAAEGTFQVQEVDDKGVPIPDSAPIIEHNELSLDDTGATIVDLTSGQVSTDPNGPDPDVAALESAKTGTGSSKNK